MNDPDKQTDLPAHDGAPAPRGDDPAPLDEELIPLEPSHKPAPTPAPKPVGRPSLTEGMSEEEIESIEREDAPAPKKKRDMRVSLQPDDIPESALGAPGRLGWRFPLIAGGAAMLIAVVMAGVYAPDGTPWWKESLRQLIDTPLYAWVGVGAVLASSQLTERAFGGVYFVLARMVFAVGVFALIWQIAGAVVVEQSWHHATHWPIAAFFGAGFYLLWCFYSFRLDRSEVGLLGGLHLLAWLVLWMFRQVGA